MAFLEIKNIKKSFGKYEVLKDISFTINPNEKIAIIGAIGSGKSTIANLIPRFYDVNKGEP